MKPRRTVGRTAFSRFELAIAHATGARAELTLRVAHEPETYVIALYGALDASNAAELDRELRRAEGTDADQIVLDLSGLHSIDSAAIDLVTGTNARLDGRLRLLRGAEPVHRKFQRTSLAAALHFIG
jgi:anti-anti-sigma factor